MNTLQVRHGVTHNRQPLAIVDGLPGAFAELTPEQLRRLAVTLNAIADDCEVIAQRPNPRKGELPAVSKTYSPAAL